MLKSNKDNRVGVKAAKITAAGAVIAAPIGAITLFIISSDSNKFSNILQEGNGNKAQIVEGDVIKTVNNYAGPTKIQLREINARLGNYVNTHLNHGSAYIKKLGHRFCVIVGVYVNNYSNS